MSSHRIPKRDRRQASGQAESRRPGISWRLPSNWRSSSLIVHYYEIGSRLHFLPVLCVAIGGFVIHSILPPRFRLVWFCALSIATVLIVLGWPNGAFVVGIGTGLIAICYVPIPFAVRVLLVVAAGVMLAFWRLDVSRPFWPILGSMFMFRLIVYLHEMRREQQRPPSH